MAVAADGVGDAWLVQSSSETAESIADYFLEKFINR